MNITIKNGNASKASVFFLVFFVMAALQSATPDSDERGSPVLEYEPCAVRVSGILRRAVFPGPPNYESVEGGDAREVIWILYPDTPVTVAGKDELNVRESGVREIQLILDEAMFRQYGEYLETRVVVSGTLIHAVSAHHRTPVLLVVENMTGE